MAINHLLANNLINLDVSKTLKGGFDPDEKGSVFAHIFDTPTRISWCSIAYLELRITVWFDFDEKKYTDAYKGDPSTIFDAYLPLTRKSDYPNFLGVAASGWIERAEGKYLMGYGGKGIIKTYARRGELVRLETLPIPTSNKFRVEGKRRM